MSPVIRQLAYPLDILSNSLLSVFPRTHRHTLIIENIGFRRFWMSIRYQLGGIRSVMRQALSTLFSSPLYAPLNTSIILFVEFSNCPSYFARSSLRTTNVSNVPIYQVD